MNAALPNEYPSAVPYTPLCTAYIADATWVGRRTLLAAHVLNRSYYTTLRQLLPHVLQQLLP
eukprot:273739-Pyramimonas_sp.AAC.1